MSEKLSKSQSSVADNRFLSAVDFLVQSFTKGFLFSGAIGIIILMSLTVVGVFWRYILNDPIVGIDDLSSITLILVAGCAVAFGATNQAHVSVSVITSFFARPITRFTDLIMRLASIFITGLAAYALYSRACGFQKACITSNLSIEHWPFYYVLAFTMLFFMFVFIFHLMVGLKFFSGSDPNEPPS